MGAFGPVSSSEPSTSFAGRRRASLPSPPRFSFLAFSPFSPLSPGAAAFPASPLPPPCSPQRGGGSRRPSRPSAPPPARLSLLPSPPPLLFSPQVPPLSPASFCPSPAREPLGHVARGGGRAGRVRGAPCRSLSAPFNHGDLNFPFTAVKLTPRYGAEPCSIACRH